MVTKDDIANASAAYEYARKEAARWGDEMLEALQNHERLTPHDNESVFLKRAERAMLAYENWRTSAERVGDILQELHKKA